MSDFVIIEYQDRIGGRTYHTTFGQQPGGLPYTIELGANWVRVPARAAAASSVWLTASRYKA